MANEPGCQVLLDDAAEHCTTINGCQSRITPHWSTFASQEGGLIIRGEFPAEDESARYSLMMLTTRSFEVENMDRAAVRASEHVQA